MSSEVRVRDARKMKIQASGQHAGDGEVTRESDAGLTAPCHVHASWPVCCRQPVDKRCQKRNTRTRARGFGPALLCLGFTYPDEPIRYRIAKNVPALTTTVTPMENTSLTSSTFLVSRRRLRIVRCQRAAFAADNTARH
jgi:hypothetical protein